LNRKQHLRSILESAKTANHNRAEKSVALEAQAAPRCRVPLNGQNLIPRSTIRRILAKLPPPELDDPKLPEQPVRVLWTIELL